MLSVLRRLSVVLTRFMGVIIIAFSALALWQPWIFSWVAPHISAMLGIIMLGMGMTLHWQDFSHVLRHPRDLGLGLVVQFGCMPLLAFALCHVFALPPELAMGMILVGTAPGGTASNVLTFIARGDVAFSVAMTAAATLVSLLLTPPLTWLLGGVWVPVDMGGLFWSIVKIVLVPVLLGLLLHHFQRGLVDRLMPFLPLASALVITLVIAGIIAVNAQNILSAGPAIFAAVIAVCLAVWLLPRGGGQTALVYQDGTLFYTLDLRQNRTLTVTGPAGKTIITVADGEVFVSHADCPDQVCVQHGPLQKNGGPIICLPNRLTIEWAENASQIDALSGTGGLS